MDHPYRLVVDFDDTSYGWRKTPLSVDAEPLKQIRGSQYKRGVARVVVELTRSVGYAIREESNGLAIVIPTGTSARGSRAGGHGQAGRGQARRDAVGAQAASHGRARGEARGDHAEGRGHEARPDEGAGRTRAHRPTAAAAPALPQVAQAPAPAPTAAPMPAPVIQTPPGGGPRPASSLDFKDADVVNLLRILAAESGRNVVIGEDVRGQDVDHASQRAPGIWRSTRSSKPRAS
mgnify:CR=1 FL=1